MEAGMHAAGIGKRTTFMVDIIHEDMNDMRVEQENNFNAVQRSQYPLDVNMYYLCAIF